MLPYFFIFQYRINAYNLITQIAAIIGFTYFAICLAKLKIKPVQILIFVILGIAVQYFGGAAIPFLYRWVYFHEKPWWTIWARSPGRYFHSVILSMILFLVVYAKCFKWPTRKILDHYSIALILASSIGRIGCFFQGCCKGKPCDLPWAIRLMRNPDTPVHPTQLYMVFLETALWIFLIHFNKRKRYDGQTFWVGALLYSVYRIGIESVRTNPIFVLGLTHAQVFSLFTLVLSSVILKIGQRKYQAPIHHLK